MKYRYTCQKCGEGCGPNEDWSEEDATAEFKRDFPGWENEPMSVLCDDCHKEFTEWLKRQRN